MFKEFNPMQYLAIDIANQFGLDKLNYEDRIEWVKANKDNLENLNSKAEEPELYWKAVNAFRKAQNGEAIGHTVALDSVCSGLQIMSAVMGCKSGAEMTGLIDPDNRVDAYTIVTDYMNELLTKDGINSITVARKDSKQGIMTALYGSISTPLKVFGEELLPYFYQALNDKCKGATQLLELLRHSWNSETLAHTWELPDGHIAHVPVMKTIETRIDIAELKYTPVVIMDINEEQGDDDMLTISNIANVVHSLDAYVLRSLVRRCNYNETKLRNALEIIKNGRDLPVDIDYESEWFICKWYETKHTDITYAELINEDNIAKCPTEMLDKLEEIINMVLSHQPFEVITVHDSFACHANHCNQLRFHYKEILAELSESTVIADILSQLYGEDISLPKLDDISHLIRGSNYGIC